MAWWRFGDRPTFAETVRRAEDAGFSSVWVMDHFYQIGFVGEPDDPMLEAYTAFRMSPALLAHQARRHDHGSHGYRYPGVLVKQVTTLDVLSGGRGLSRH